MTTAKAIRLLRSAYGRAIEKGETEVSVPTEVAFRVLRYRCSKETTPKPYASELDWKPFEQSPPLDS